MRRFPALSLFSGHRGHPGLSAVLSVGEECTLAPGTVRMETAVQAAHWYIALSLLHTLFLSLPVLTRAAGIQFSETLSIYDNQEALRRRKTKSLSTLSGNPPAHSLTKHISLDIF